MNGLGLISDLAGCAACDAVKHVRMGELSNIGEVEQYISASLSKFFDQYGPTLAAKMTDLIKPATEKAVNVIKPTVMQALKDYTPTFAAVTGGMIALSVLLGVWVSKRTYQRHVRGSM